MNHVWQIPAPRWAERISLRSYVWIAVGLIAAQALALYLMGRPPICTCGTVKPWVGLVSSPETSQQLLDWYTYTHVVHGFGFYLLLSLITPGSPFGLKFALAIGMESAWEVVENTPFVIERYRQLAIAHGYFGDSIVNSVMDTLAAACGVGLAYLLPVWATVTLTIGMESFVAFMIHDNLTLNIIQLVHPFDAISRWQQNIP
jgi:hypothetical protein